jgi:hypothetical protein
MKCRRGHEIKDGSVWPVHGVLGITTCCKRVTAPNVVLDWAVMERFIKTTYTLITSFSNRSVKVSVEVEGVE